MRNQRRPVWLHSIFQVSLIFLTFFLVLALLFWLFNFGRPSVAVAIALDLSNSTYSGKPALFNKSGTVMSKEVEAVHAYVKQNQALLKNPNLIQVFGFGERVRPLNNAFTNNTQQLTNELNQQLADPNLANLIGGSQTNISQAIEVGTHALAGVQDRCRRELLIVTDGQATVTPEAIASAIQQKVKINIIVVGSEAPELRSVSEKTEGLYLSGKQSDLSIFFSSNLFGRFNNNYRWLLLWIGAAWIALMWVLILPLDRWILQDLFKMHWNIAGKIALSHALFWSALTPLIVWQLWQLLGILGLTAC